LSLHGVVKLGLALAKADHHAHKPAIASQAGLRAFNSIAPAPAQLSADEMKWSPEKTGGGSMGFNTHDEVKNQIASADLLHKACLERAFSHFSTAGL
jgi:hypothetical protein